MGLERVPFCVRKGFVVQFNGEAPMFGSERLRATRPANAGAGCGTCPWTAPAQLRWGPSRTFV